MATQKSTVRAVIAKHQENAKQPANKETVSAFSLVVLHKGQLKEVVTVRVYMGRSSSASEVYACVWVKGQEQWTSGRGSAGGYGYHKESQAIASAISSAGIELYGDPYPRRDTPVDMKSRLHFGGTGSSGYEVIFKAIARAAGYSTTRAILVSH